MESVSNHRLRQFLKLAISMANIAAISFEFKAEVTPKFIVDDQITSLIS